MRRVFNRRRSLAARGGWSEAESASRGIGVYRKSAKLQNNVVASNLALAFSGIFHIIILRGDFFPRANLSSGRAR